MKFFSLFVTTLIIHSVLSAQELQIIPESKFRLSLTYGITAVNPEDINTRIASSNAAFGSTTKSLKSMPEMTATISLRPTDDMKVVILRGGYILSKREFSFSVPETQNGPTPTGTTNGTITETYTAYPLSIGIGGTTEKSDAQFQLEFIYGLGYVREEGTYTSSAGKKTSYSRSLFSPTYGFRVNGSIVAPLTSFIGLQFEAGYRYLLFDEFEDEITAQSSPLDFSMSGIQGRIGLSVKL